MFSSAYGRQKKKIGQSDFMTLWVICQFGSRIIASQNGATRMLQALKARA
jgi:hypothetical protein